MTNTAAAEENTADHASSVQASSATPAVFLPQTLNQLMTGFRNGVIPDFNNPEQAAMFEVYRVTYFGDPLTSLDPDTLKRLASVQQEQPGLSKDTLSDVRWTTKTLTSPPPASLELLTRVLTNSANQIKSNVLQFDKNRGFWRKLGFGKGEGFKGYFGNDASLSAFFTRAANRKFLDQNLPLQKRILALSRSLIKLAERNERAGHDTKRLRRFIVDIVHNVGFVDPVNDRRMKSADMVEVLKAVETGLSARDELARKLRYKNFASFAAAMGMGEASCLEQFPDIHAAFQKIGREVEQTITPEYVRTRERTVRHLSLTESPYRSCLGDDCASRSYLETALESEYHYFTLTGTDGHSTGQITIVLGTALHQRRQIKVGFVDKIQNVPDSDLEGMLEAVRLSLKKEGFGLMVPKHVGNEDGLSNDFETSLFVKNQLTTKDVSKLLKGFKPYRDKAVHWENFYSQADRSPQGYLLMPSQEALSDYEVLPKRDPSRLGPFSFQGFLSEVSAWKAGDSADKIKYAAAATRLTQLGVKIDDHIEDLLVEWATDLSASPKLRYRALNALMDLESKGVMPALKSLDPASMSGILQNWIQKPHLEERIRTNPVFLDLVLPTASAPGISGKTRVALVIFALQHLRDVERRLEPALLSLSELEREWLFEKLLSNASLETSLTSNALELLPFLPSANQRLKNLFYEMITDHRGRNINGMRINAYMDKFGDSQDPFIQRLLLFYATRFVYQSETMVASGLQRDKHHALLLFLARSEELFEVLKSKLSKRMAEFQAQIADLLRHSESQGRPEIKRVFEYFEVVRASKCSEAITLEAVGHGQSQL